MPKTYQPKTYQERVTSRAAKTAAILGLVEDCDFETDAFFEFQHDNSAQAATRVTSRTDPEFRFLVLHHWPDAVSDPQQSKFRVICPPGHEKDAGIVCTAVRVFWANRYAKQLTRPAGQLRHKELPL